MKKKEMVTIYKVKIIDSFKGDVVKGDVVEIKQFGGEKRKILYI